MAENELYQLYYQNKQESFFVIKQFFKHLNPAISRITGWLKPKHLIIFLCVHLTFTRYSSKQNNFGFNDLEN